MGKSVVRVSANHLALSLFPSSNVTIEEVRKGPEVYGVFELTISGEAVPDVRAVHAIVHREDRVEFIDADQPGKEP